MMEIFNGDGDHRQDRPSGPDDELQLGTGDLTWQEVGEALWLAALRTDAEETAQDAGEDRDLTSPELSERNEEGSRHMAGNGRSWPQFPPGIARDGHSRSVPDFPEAITGNFTVRHGGAVRGTRRARGSVLPDSMAMARSLRPFKRTVLSRWSDELDEEVTAQHAAEDGLWLPYTKPAPARWLDVALIIDDGPSMSAWQNTITQFAALLEQVAAFRDVRSRFIEVRPGENQDDPTRVFLRGSARGAALSEPGELLGSPGQRLVILLTDGLGNAWRSGAMHNTLALWGQSASVVIIHLLPQQFWHRTAVATRRVRLRAPGPATPNRQYRVDIPLSWRGAFERGIAADAIAIPVLELSTEWLAWWARLVTRDGQDWQEATALLVSGSGVAEPFIPVSPLTGDEYVAPATGRERVLSFRANASPTALRLATHLAAAPVEPAFIRTVQDMLLPESRPSHVAEILLSGLLRPLPSPSSGKVGPVSLDFIDGAREALLAGATRADTARVFAAASDHFGERVPEVRSMRAALLSPDQAPDPAVTTRTLPFARVEFAVLRALSGPYLSRARRIGQAIADLDRDTARFTPVLSPEGSADLSTETTGPVSAPERATASANEISETLDEVGIHMHEGNVRPPLTADTARETALGTSTAEPESLASLPRLDESADPSGITAAAVGHENVHYQRSHVTPPVWGNVPPKNPNFTGRDDLLAHLHDQLQLNSTAAVLPHTLQGMGGVGKSQIAVEYVYRHASDYDIIWWVSAEQQGQILSSLASLAQSLGLDVGTEANSAVPAVREALRAGRPYKNWLIVFDNAEDVKAVRQFFPTGGTGKILVTSRNPEWDRVALTLSVDVFKRVESKELLQRRNKDLSDSEADRLSEALGDLPLAIEQAASWRAATGMTVDEYMTLIEQKRTELLDVAPSPDYPVSVAAAWNVSLDRLEENNRAALHMLQICAFFAPEPISRDLFRGSRNVALTPELDDALRDPMKLSRAIRGIHQYALARIEHQSNTIQLHRLVQAVIVGRMPPEVQDQMQHGAHVLLADANPNSPGSSDQWPRYQALLPHVNVSRVIECDDPWVRQLLIGMTEFLYYWGDHEGSLLTAREVTRAWTTRFGEEDGQTLQVARWLAFDLRVLGYYEEAARLHERLLEIYRRNMGEDDEGTLSVMLQIGGDMRVRGDFKSAREQDELVLARSRRAFGDDDPATLFAAHNFAVSLRLAGDFRTALELDEDTWQRRAIVLGEDNSSTLSTLNGLAIDQRECGDYLEARLRQEETYRRTVEKFGPNNPATIRAARNLSVCRRRAGDHKGARSLSQETLNRFQRRYGDSYPDTLAAAMNFAVDLRQTGDIEGSRDLGEQTFATYARTLGDRHPYTLSVRANLAVSLRLLGDIEAAYQHNSKILPIFKETLGENHVLTLTCATNLGSDYFAQEDFQRALEQDTDTLERLRQALGNDHPSTLACAFNVSLDLRAVGKTREGDTLRTDTISRFRAVLGNSHPATVAAVRGLRADSDIAPMPL